MLTLDISTSFKRLRAEKVAADKLIKEVSPLEGIGDLDGLRAYLTNQKMKVEVCYLTADMISADAPLRSFRRKKSNA